MNLVKQANVKRNFDELDGSRFGAFYKKKRNFDQLLKPYAFIDNCRF